MFTNDNNGSLWMKPWRCNPRGRRCIKFCHVARNYSVIFSKFCTSSWRIRVFVSLQDVCMCTSALSLGECLRGSVMLTHYDLFSLDICFSLESARLIVRLKKWRSCLLQTSLLRVRAIYCKYRCKLLRFVIVQDEWTFRKFRCARTAGSEVEFFGTARLFIRFSSKLSTKFKIDTVG